ncbi:hypothetical protein ABMB44_15445 [Levilactobacillus brevis]
MCKSLRQINEKGTDSLQASAEETAKYEVKSADYMTVDDEQRKVPTPTVRSFRPSRFNREIGTTFKKSLTCGHYIMSERFLITVSAVWKHFRHKKAPPVLST